MEKPKRYKTRSVNTEKLEPAEGAIQRICNEELEKGWILINALSVPHIVWSNGSIDISIYLVFAQY